MMWTRSANSHTGPRHLNGRTSEAGQMSAPDYTQRLTDRFFLLSRGCPQMCQASNCGHAAGRYGDTQARCRSITRALGSLGFVASLASTSPISLMRWNGPTDYGI